MPPEAWGPGPPTPPATPDVSIRVTPFARDADVKKMPRAAAFDARREIETIKTFIQTRMAAGHSERAVRRALQAMQAEVGLMAFCFANPPDDGPCGRHHGRAGLDGGAG